MVSIGTFRKIALSFPDVSEEPHFEKISFRVKKKIFATYDDLNKRACIKLSERDQDIFALTDRATIYPVDNKWGKQGWTIIELKKVNKNLFTDALTTAYCEVAPKKLAEKLRPNQNDKMNNNL
jgi:predicted DNA-binding protein (MmcQ/YjbR family)